MRASIKIYGRKKPQTQYEKTEKNTEFKKTTFDP